MANILIAEDDQAICNLLSIVIKNMGHNAMFSPNGRHAWESLEINQDLDLLIADYMMPELNGRDLIIKLRENERMKNMPVIMISAVVGPKAIADLLDIGVTLFLPKPLDISTLQEYIARTVGSKTETQNECSS
jgi:CheY-like chemotaxis protein